MTIDFSSLNQDLDFNVTKNTYTVLLNGLLLSHAKDDNGQPRIDAASDAIALGLDTVYTISQDESEVEDPLWLMFTFLVDFIRLVPYNNEPAMDSFAKGVAKLSAKNRPETYEEFYIPKRLWADLPNFFPIVHECYGFP